MLGVLASGGLAIAMWNMPFGFFYEKLWLRIAFLALAVVIALVLLLSLVIYRNYMRVSGIFLDHASRFIRSRPWTAVYIPIMLVLAGGLIALTVFELLAVWSQHRPLFHKHLIFHKAHPTNYTIALTAAVLAQFYFGLHFLRQMCKQCSYTVNFMVTGAAIGWYFHLPPDECSNLRRMLRFHLGSVVAAAFMAGVFWIPDLVFDLLRPRNEQGLYGRCFVCLCGWLNNLFQLVRSDAIAYVNLASMSYCDSARFCEFLCRNSKIFHSSSSVSRVLSTITVVL